MDPLIDLDDRIDEFLRVHPPDEYDDRRLREARFDAGLAFIHFAEGAGGLGLEASLQGVVDRRFDSAGCPDWLDRNIIGLGMAAPTIHAHGSRSQKALLRPLFSGEHVWCQLFSEPGAGSDLASIATRAVRDGDSWVVSGQKVWTSLGHVASFGLLVARTDPAVPKHQGLTYFLLDMTLPGVDVRPLRQLTGEAEFNEVYLNDVRVPDSARLGEVGQGWQVAMTTLTNERATLGDVAGDRESGPIGQAMALYRSVIQRAGTVEPALWTRLVQLWCAAETNRLMSAHLAASHGDKGPGAEGSMIKLRMAELNQSIYELCVDLMGMDGVLYDSFALTRPHQSSVQGAADPRRAYLRSLANSIEGGTSEIQRTVIGERLLGMPREPDLFKDRPWNVVPRG